jgi:hypothetical protein
LKWPALRKPISVILHTINSHGAEETGKQASVAEEQVEVFLYIRLAAPDAQKGAADRS